jgi:hypothetical protein
MKAGRVLVLLLAVGGLAMLSTLAKAEAFHEDAPGLSL